jgi:hypothetical protein
MTGTTESTLHYLVIDAQHERPILVFLGHDPVADGPLAVPVHLERLPPVERFGRPGRPAVGRPVLGQARGSRTRFREFASHADLWEAGFLPVPCYRICDDWADYHSPWTARVAEQETNAVADESV